MAERANKAKLYTLLRALMAVCVVGIGVSAYLMIQSNREYAKGDSVYAEVRLSLESNAKSEETPPADAAPTAAAVDFTALKAVNPDTAAWLLSEGSVIDYPVVQGQDNDYYLTHLFNGETNKLGSLFVDYRNSGDFTDQNTVIYGHNMKDGSMFASLTQYSDQSYYDSLPEMQLYTPDGMYSIRLFAGVLADGSYEFVRFGFTDDQDFLGYIDSLKADSTFRSEVSVSAEDRIVTLCTCSYAFNNARYALFGKLVPLAA